MKKEEKDQQGVPKHRSVYKYQLKATNQILKDTLDLCQSSIYSTARTNKHRYAPYEDYDLTPHQERSTTRKAQSVPPKNHKDKKPRKPSFPDFCRQKNDKTLVFQEFGQIQSFFHKDLQPKHSKQKHYQEDYDGSEYLNPHPPSYSSDNENYPSNRAPMISEKSLESSHRKHLNQEGKKQTKKQRRGLAEISLKVKNIVARMGKMTFKEVSDEVLKQSEQDLPNDPEQREKQTKNIRRRVYDALNVLVSVKILGKQQRCVVHTPATNIPGKKLSEHWNIINEKNRVLEQRKNQYSKKLANLNLLKKHIQMMEMFQERNRKINEMSDKKQQATCSQLRQQYNYLHRWNFPLVFLIPPNNINNKIKIQLQYQDDNVDFLKKITIDNNDYILTDLDVLKYIDLKKINKNPGKSQSISIDKINHNVIEQQKREKVVSKKEEQDEIFLSD